MFDLGISKLIMIGIVALIVIGPEKLPRVARTVGALIARAQRYINSVKDEVNRAIDLDELRKIKTTIEDAAREAQTSLNEQVERVQKEFHEISEDISKLPSSKGANASLRSDYAQLEESEKEESQEIEYYVPTYQPPRKEWRKRRTAVPHWYKARHQGRQKLLSVAARRAKHQQQLRGTLSQARKIKNISNDK